MKAVPSRNRPPRAKRAYVAVVHSMLIAIYHIPKDSVAFKDLGDIYYNQFNKERKINAYLKKLKALDWKAPVVLPPEPVSEVQKEPFRV